MPHIARKGVVAAALMLVSAPVFAADLALKRVALSSGGVGYFEYEAQVAGDAKLAIEVPLDQVDDVLKSLVVYDAEGSAGEVTLPGREPLSQGFADLPFDRDALGSEAKLLNALQGAEIRVQGPKPLSGRLVHVEEETLPHSDFPPLKQTRITVLTDAGLQQAVLQDVEAIAFADPELQGKVKTALQRIAAYRGDQRRRLTLTVHGAKPRRVRVGYAVAAPLWKASYRLNLPADPETPKARLQGWAVLENFSGQDWHDVELTLLSGNPVTFRQALYQSYYVPRPSVPIESGGRVLPPADTGTVGGAKMALAPPAAPAPPAALRAAPALASPPPLAQQFERAEAAEGATQIAFTLPAPVDAAVGQSLVVPLLDRDLPGRQLDLYQQATERTHPLAAIELTNDSASGLPPGVLTLYQDGEHGAAYLGDARLAALPAGDKRVLSYAVDNKVTIDASTSERQPVVKATAAGGVLRLIRQIRRTTTYRIKAASVPGRLVIEHPRRPGWSLTQPELKTVQTTESAYRIPAEPGGKSEAVFTVVEEQPLEEKIALTDLAEDRLDALVASTELDPKVREAMTELAAKRRGLTERRSDLDRLIQERTRFVADETRLRDNLSALGGEANLRKRLLDSFTATESQIETMTAEIATASAAVDAAERDLSAYIAGLSL
ncbi:MAG TPA: DUF4139 domain-containing protein [Stellaceae bacterium]